MSGMLTVFFYARLWRRAGVITDVEFAEIRYGGKPAAFLRGFRALYLGLPINCIIMGWVNLAMVKILMMIFGVTKIQALMLVFGIMLVTAMISTLSGLWGVLVMDMFQFVLKMGMVIVLAYYAVQAVGGMGALHDKLMAIDAAKEATSGGQGSILSFLPDSNSPVDADDHLLRLHRQSTGGRPGIRAPSRAAAATSRSASSAPRTRRTRSSPPSGSTSPTTRCVPGRGS